jgi:hypothetical protein
LRGKQFFVPLASHCRLVFDISFPALCAHAQQSVHVWLESVSNKGNFTRDAERVLCPYLASHCSVITEISQIVLSALAPQSGPSVFEIGP